MPVNREVSDLSHKSGPFTSTKVVYMQMTNRTEWPAILQI